MAKTPPARSNIYTVLAFIALVALLGGIIYTFIRLNELGIDPFSYPSTAALREGLGALGLA